MRQTDYRRYVPLFMLSVFTTVSGFTSLFSLDLSLNNRSLSVLDDSTLAAWSRKSIIPLQTLYPWMKSVDYMEAQSGANRVFWSNVEDWNKVQLVLRDGIWEVHVGRDIFSNPDRINIKGERRNISALTIWSAIDNPDFKTDLLSALYFRGVRVEWKDITRPEYLLTSPPADGLPDIILLDQFQLLRMRSLIGTSRPISRQSSLWFSSSPSTSPEVFPLAVDAYQGEAALLYLLAENPLLFGENGLLPPGLTRLFNWASASRGSELLNTDSPLASLSSGDAATAVILPSSAEPQIHSSSPPEGTVNISQLQFAAVPAALNQADAETAALVLDDAARFNSLQKNNQTVDIPMDPRILRFFDAYERIGRLAITGQLESREAVNLINSYVNENENSE